MPQEKRKRTARWWIKAVCAFLAGAYVLQLLLVLAVEIFPVEERIIDPPGVHLQTKRGVWLPIHLLPGFGAVMLLVPHGPHRIVASYNGVTKEVGIDLPEDQPLDELILVTSPVSIEVQTKFRRVLFQFDR